MNPVRNSKPKHLSFKDVNKVKISNGVKAMRIIVTAGPTREPIDPVRFISNYSTGAMGYAIAKAAKSKAHQVTLITGPAAVAPPKGIKTIAVTTAIDMFKAVKRNAANADCVIMAAAVSDFRPAAHYKSKLKRTKAPQPLRLKKNPDILAWLGKRKGPKLLVGFCMETERLVSNAMRKLFEKNLDIIVANKIDAKKSAFGIEKTNVVIIEPSCRQLRLKNTTKEKVAAILLDKIQRIWYKGK